MFLKYNLKTFQICLFIFIFFWSSLLLAQSITITDSRGKQTLNSVPQKVVVLNWDTLEQLLELEVVPIAAPNLPAYKQWVVKPYPPSSIVDIGTRFEPNLEKIASLKPDIIIASEPQKDLITKLEAIAPVLYFSNHEISDNAYSVAVEQFKTLSVVFNKEHIAQQKLDNMEKTFIKLKEELTKAFKGKLPSVVAMRFANDSSVYIYTQNSITNSVIEKLGLKVAIQKPAARWGISQQRLTYLQNVKEDSYVLYFLPFPEREKVEKSVLWQAMPFVRNKQVNSVNSVWNYGGAMSIKYIAEEVTKSLLEVAPKNDN